MLGHLRDLHAQRIKRVEHHTRVVRIKHVTHARDLAFGRQRRKQQHAVGNAFRAREFDVATGGGGGGEGDVFHVYSNHKMCKSGE